MMPNNLPLPDDLQSLIEKREQDDHRQAERRTEQVDSISENDLDSRSGKEQRQSPRRHDENS